MAYNEKRLAGEYQEPLSETKESDKQYYEQLRQSMAAEFSDVGIYINEQGFEKTKSGQPRFFEMTEDGTFKNALENGADVKSDAFLDKLSQGRIFTFAAGQGFPTQITTAEGKLRFSRAVGKVPAAPEPVAPQEPKPMGRWARFANWITGGRAYKQERADYNASVEKFQKDTEQYQKDLAKKQKETNINKGLRDLHNDRATVDMEAENEREWAASMTQEKPTYSIDQYRNTLQECYGPKPVFHEEFCQEYGGQSYTKAQFGVLQDYSGSIEGAGISDSEFTAIAMFGAFDPEIGSRFDPKQDVGLTPEESIGKNISMFTDTVNAGKVTSRPAHGKIYETVVQPAREKTVQAIEEYKQGNPEKLARQIGEGMHMLSNHYAGKAIDNEHFLSITSMSGDVMGLLERDPKLKAETEKAMTELAAKDNPNAAPEELKAQVKRSFDLANGQKKAADLTRRNEKAKGMLKAESLGICKLSKEQRKEYIDDRLAFETVRENTANDIYLQEHGEIYQAGMDQLNKKFVEATMSGDIAQKNHAEAATQMYTEDTIHAPQAVVMMGKNDKTVGAMVESRLPNRDKLYELSGEELVNALEPKNLLAENSPYTQKPEPTKQEPEKQKTVEKTVEQVEDQGIGY